MNVPFIRDRLMALSTAISGGLIHPYAVHAALQAIPCRSTPRLLERVTPRDPSSMVPLLINAISPLPFQVCLGKSDAAEASSMLKHIEQVLRMLVGSGPAPVVPTLLQPGRVVDQPILFLEGDQTTFLGLTDYLRRQGFQSIRSVGSAGDGLRHLVENRAVTLLISEFALRDLDRSGIKDGIAFFRQAQALRKGSESPFIDGIILSGMASVETEAQGPLVLDGVVPPEEIEGHIRARLYRFRQQESPQKRRGGPIRRRSSGIPPAPADLLKTQG